MNRTKEELQHHWNYYETLSRRLEDTSRYVNHVSVSGSNKPVNNNDTYSVEFEQIIVLSAVEFENVCKLLCREIDSKFNMKWSSITKISQTILSAYPHIVEMEVSTYYAVFKPLEHWEVSKQPNPDNPQKMIDYVEGLQWWNVYDDLKHQGYDVFDQANLGNAIKAVSALLVMNLYLQKVVDGNLQIASSSINSYFQTDYTSKVLATGEGKLPDFGNKKSSIVDTTDESLVLSTK